MTGAAPAGETVPGCALCDAPGGEIVWQDDRLRVILPHEPEHPGLTRIVWSAHASEMTDLTPADRAHLMAVVWRVEQAQRAALQPDKVNLASLGNVVAHLHWHVIPRWRDDRHFPQPIWAPPAPGRDGQAAVSRAAARLPAYRAALATLAG